MQFRQQSLFYEILNYSFTTFPKLGNHENQLEIGLIKPVLVSGNFGLVAKGVGKSFNKRRVVRNVSIELQRGEAVGLLGPNGEGKTTFLIILGVKVIK